MKGGSINTFKQFPKEKEIVAQPFFQLSDINLDELSLQSNDDTVVRYAE